MRVGLALPQFDFSVAGERSLRWPTLVAWAQRAEQLGFHAIWLADHLFWDLPAGGGPPERASSYDPLPALAALARRTGSVRVGTLVLCAPLRPPSVLAKALATLDVLSRGRLTVGLGDEPEFAAAGVPFEDHRTRLGQLEEAVAVVRGLFGGGPFTYRGRHWSVEGARCLPVPVQRPHPPIWLGGRSDGLLRLAAAAADGWNTAWSSTPDAYRERTAVLDEACERVGRDPATLTRSLGLLALVGEDDADLRRRYERLRDAAPAGARPGASLDEWRRGRLVGTVEHVREQLAAWRDLGVADLAVSAAAVPFAAASADDVDMVAEACSLVPPCQPSEPRN